ncbi:hypothetical protein [Sulfuritalea sp.]|uniref:hypothetical protein n=1 Tax=Sulfuritalea sp. TaxID=2480090 RepID=UPI00286E4C3F|nr:hypothetical protein [Sulfuritalea sp.]
MAHWFRREFDLRLTAWQLATLLAGAGALVCVLLLYRHQTDLALVEVWDFLGSVQIGVPPLAALLATYTWAFLSGNKLADAPRDLLRWLRNVALQERHTMLAILVASAMLASITTWRLARVAPPAYVALTAQLLGGENDDHEILAQRTKQIKERNPKFAARLELLRQVFAERRKWNNDEGRPNTTVPRLLIRAMENDNDPAWAAHPLKWHGLGEAFSMFVQAAASSAGESNQLLDEMRAESLAHYQRVIDTDDPRATPLMRASAENNLGNVYFYAGQFEAAVDQYRRSFGREPSIEAQANRVAALVMLGRSGEAIQAGEEVIAWALASGRATDKINGYVGLLSNLGFARMIAGDGDKAATAMREAFDLQPDALARQNLALALVAAGRSDDALTVLEVDTAAPAVTAKSELEIVAKFGGGSCSYLIRALAQAKMRTADEAANLAAYLRRPRAAAELTRADAWRAPAWAALLADKRACRHLQLLPFVRDVLAPAPSMTPRGAAGRV